MDKYRGNIVVSRKAITENELKEQKKELLNNIKEGWYRWKSKKFN